MCSLPCSSSSSSPTPCESDRSSLPEAGSTPLDWWLSQTWSSQHTGDQHGYTWVMQHGGVLYWVDGFNTKGRKGCACVCVGGWLQCYVK